MEALTAARTQSDALPSINYLDFGSAKTGPEDSHNHPPSITPLTMSNQNHIYSGPPPPYSYPSSTAPTSVALNGLISPPDSRRTSGDDKEEASPHKQSLPSIHEALGRDQHLPYPAPHSPSQPQQQQPTHHDLPHSISPKTPIPRSCPPENAHPHSHSSVSHIAATPSHPSLPASVPPTQPYNSQYASIDAYRHNLPAANAHDKLPSLHSLRTAVSPGPPASAVPYAMKPSQPSPVNEHGSSNSHGYGHYQSHGQYPPPSTNGSHSIGQAPMPRNLPSYSSRFDGSEVSRVQEAQQSSKGYKGVNGERYGVSVKRHLDYFDLEASLNEMADSSGRLNDFSRDFKDRARELPRTGPVPGSLPSISECDDMIRHQNRVQDLLARLREMLVSQQNAINQQGADRYKSSADYDLDDGAAYDEVKAGVSLGGPDAKKRRGRAAPPGRCHSCNRAETPEWRRGPDGARTLCNACGLHYAKLTRKMGSKATVPGSSLRPKSIGPNSPQ